MKNFVSGLLLLSLISCTTLPGTAAMSNADLEQVISKAGVLPEGAKTTVAVQGSEALLSTNSHNANDNDLKIEAVLLARKIFESEPTLVRVSVHYYGANQAEYKKISVSSADVKAYSAGLTTQTELLTSLVITQETDVRFSKNASKGDDSQSADKSSEKSAAKSAAADPDSAETSSALSTGDKKPDGPGAREGDSKVSSAGKELEKDKGKSEQEKKKGTFEKLTAEGLTIYYPAEWEKRWTEDKDDPSIYQLKFAHNDYVEMKYYPNAVSVQAIYDSAHKAHLRYKDYQAVKVSPLVKFGANKSMVGIQSSFWHTKHNKAQDITSVVFERHVCFGVPKRVYRLKCRASKANAGYMNAAFEKILTSAAYAATPSTKSGAGGSKSP